MPFALPRRILPAEREEGPTPCAMLHPRSRHGSDRLSRLREDARAIYDSIVPPGEGALLAPRSPYSPPPLQGDRRCKAAIACIRPTAIVSWLADVRRKTALAGAKTMLSRAFARRCGACLALAALMLQFALSFAHVHRHDLVPSGFERTDGVSAGHARSAPQAMAQLPSRLADDDDFCQICFSTFLLSNSSLPDAPTNQYSLQFAEIVPASNPFSDRLFRPRHTAFLSRAPPAA